MKQKGFTLIEIIVVLIILGVLAAIALPNLYSWIERSRAAEAIVQLSIIYKDITACCIRGKNQNECEIEFNTRQAEYNTKYFTYKMDSVFTYGKAIIAERNNVEAFNDPGSTMTCTIDDNGTYPTSTHSQLGITVKFNANRSTTLTQCTITSGFYKGLI